MPKKENQNKELILIGICTYNRPKMLEECLNSLVAQTLPKGADIIFCIADNNSLSEHNIKNIVDKVLKGWSYEYSFVEKRGISFTRNALLKCALKNKADYIAFIDDDEFADKDWINNLYKKIKSSGADVVQGKMQFKLPENTPEFVASMWKSASEEDAKLTFVATGNVIFSKKLVTDWQLRFHEKLALTGGEDLDFFLKSHNKGGRHIFTNSGVVYEVVPKERATMQWQLQRRKQEGFVIHYVLLLNQGRLYVIRKYFIKSLVNIIKSPFYILTGIVLSDEKVKYKGRRKLYNAVGCLACCCNIKILSYKNITGN